MHIDKYKKEDGYYGPDDCFSETAMNFMQGQILDFCCCGRPEDSLLFMRDVLAHIDGRNRKTWDEWNADGAKLFATDGAMYFTFYVLDKKGLTEHGGSVPGWLTPKGREIMEDITEILAHSED